MNRPPLAVGQIWQQNNTRWYILSQGGGTFRAAVTYNDEFRYDTSVDEDELEGAIALSHYSAKDLLLASLLREKVAQPSEKKLYLNQFARRVEDIFYYHGLTPRQSVTLHEMFEEFGIKPRRTW